MKGSKKSVGMGLDLYQNSPAARAVFEEVDASLGVSLSYLLFNGPEEELTKTVNAQPAIMAVSIACLRGMEDAMGEGTMPVPSLVAGHSLGEYTALLCAGVINFEDAIKDLKKAFQGNLLPNSLIDGYTYNTVYDTQNKALNIVVVTNYRVKCIVIGRFSPHFSLRELSPVHRLVD